MFTVAVGGMLIDKFGVNVVAFVLLLLTCIGTLIQAIATPSGLITSPTTTVAWLVVGRIILGGSGEILYTAQGRMLKTHIPQRSLGISFAIIFSLGIIGSVHESDSVLHSVNSTFVALNALPGVVTVSNLKVAAWITFGSASFHPLYGCRGEENYFAGGPVGRKHSTSQVICAASRSHWRKCRC